jgi:puromycin-sensitive aminopeptidase
VCRIDADKAGKLGDWPEATDSTSKVVPVTGIEFEAEWETCVVSLGAELRSFNTNVFLLRVSYHSKFNEQMRGFYLSFWKNQAIATTQFEPTDARRSFPCWDEPSFKATFSVDITVPNRALQVISNMPVLELKSTPQENFVFYRFEKSPIMSTYLVAYVIGKFDFLSSRSKKGVEVRVYVMPGKLEQARFAIKTATAALDFFVDFFGIDYPLVSPRFFFSF